MSFFIEKIVAAIHSIFPTSDQHIALHEPCLQGREWEYIKTCLETGWVSSVGQYVDRFEKDLAAFTGINHVIAAVNGTAALHIAYLLAGIKTNDEVLVPTLTFVGTVNPLSYCGAIPHFIDSEAQTLGINAVVLDDYLKEITEIHQQTCINKITGRRIRALCVMHTLGHPVDLDPLVALCEKYHLTLIEDAAEALGSLYKNKHVGHHGLISTLSFNGNKTITTGGGGAILTNHPTLAKKAKHLTTTAKLPHRWAFHHDEVGYNYRLPNINAALGCAQLEQAAAFIEVKRILAHHYQQLFSQIEHITCIKEPIYAKSNYWLNAVLLDDTRAHLRDVLIEALHQKNIMARPLWELQHTLPMYAHCPRMPLPIADNLSKRLIKLPSSACWGVRLTQGNNACNVS